MSSVADLALVAGACARLAAEEADLALAGKPHHYAARRDELVSALAEFATGLATQTDHPGARALLEWLVQAVNLLQVGLASPALLAMVNVRITQFRAGVFLAMAAG